MSGWTEEQMQSRMHRDAEMMKDSDRWPGPLLRLKTQPWISEKEGMKFAAIHFLDPMNVIEDSGGSHRYANHRDMVNRWSVD